MSAPRLSLEQTEFRTVEFLPQRHKPDELLMKLDYITRLQKLVPFVQKAFTEKYSKKAISDPKRVACSLCLNVGPELAQLAQAVKSEVWGYDEVYSQSSNSRAEVFQILRERRQASDDLYNRIVAYFENEEWEELRVKPRAVKQKIVGDDFPNLSGPTPQSTSKPWGARPTEKKIVASDFPGLTSDFPGHEPGTSWDGETRLY